MTAEKMRAYKQELQPPKLRLIKATGGWYWWVPVNGGMTLLGPVSGMTIQQAALMHTENELRRFRERRAVERQAIFGDKR